MAFGGLLALLDDLTVLLDDIAAMSKVAAGKTAGITGDDLAVNAEALTGLDPKRELPIVWAVTKGSLKNKAILVPAALLLNAFAPFLITPLLMIGGVFLCYEGVEKIIHAWEKSKNKAHHAHLAAAAKRGEDDLLSFEQTKIKQAVQTDLILSAEIVAIALATVATAPFLTQVSVLAIIALGMTVIVYGLVGLIVKLDDIGLYLSRKKDRLRQKIGLGMIRVLPGLMKTISIVGTAAMFTVGGGILIHGMHFLSQMISDFSVAHLPGGWPHVLFSFAASAVVGIIAGGIAVAALEQGKKLRPKKA